VNLARVKPIRWWQPNQLNSIGAIQDETFRCVNDTSIAHAANNSCGANVAAGHWR